MKNCPYCGQPNPEENQFCGKCGKDIVNVQLAVSDVQVEQTSEGEQSVGKQRAKKIVVILVLIAIVLGIVFIAQKPELFAGGGSGNQGDAGNYSSKDVVELTPENFEDYFFLEVSVENYTNDIKTDLALPFGVLFYEATADVVISCKPRSACTLNNVSAEFELLYYSSTSNDWHEVDGIRTITKDYPLVISENLPVNGEMQETISIESSIDAAESSSGVDYPDFTIRVSSVTGTLQGV